MKPTDRLANLTWDNILRNPDKCSYSDFKSFSELALKLGYPYYLFNDRVRETGSNFDTGFCWNWETKKFEYEGYRDDTLNEIGEKRSKVIAEINRLTKDLEAINKLLEVD